MFILSSNMACVCSPYYAPSDWLTLGNYVFFRNAHCLITCLHKQRKDIKRSTALFLKIVAAENDDLAGTP